MEISWMQHPENVRLALILMAAGMVGIFAVMIVLILAVTVLNRFKPKEKEDKD